MTKQLDAIITFAEQLNELDTENVEPTSHVLDMKNVLREDVPQKGIAREEVLKNAQKSRMVKLKYHLLWNKEEKQ